MASSAVNVAVDVDHKNTDIRNAAHGVIPILCIYIYAIFKSYIEVMIEQWVKYVPLLQAGTCSNIRN